MSIVLPGQQQPPPPRSRFWGGIKALFRARITAGLIIVLPIWLTYLLVKFVFGLMRDASLWVLHLLGVETRLEETVSGKIPNWVPDFLRSWTTMTDQQLGHAIVEWGIGIFSVLLTMFILYAIGLLTANIVGKRFIDLLDRILDRVPLVKTVYRSSKQILSTFSGEQSQNFQRVVLIPYPDENMRSVGFITKVFPDAVTGEELCAVFCFTSPNPTTGYAFIVARSRVIELNWSVEDAVRMVMSGGILCPETVSLVPTHQQRHLMQQSHPTVIHIQT